MTMHFISEKHRRFHIKFLSCLLIQWPGGNPKFLRYISIVSLCAFLHAQYMCSGEVECVLITICFTTNVQLKGNKTFQQPKSSDTSIHHAT